MWYNKKGFEKNGLDLKEAINKEKPFEGIIMDNQVKQIMRYLNKNQIWHGHSEITGKEEYFRDTGEIIHDFSFAKYGSYTIFTSNSRFQSFESYLRFRIEIMTSLLSTINQVKQGEIWEPCSEKHYLINFSIEYQMVKLAMLKCI